MLIVYFAADRPTILSKRAGKSAIQLAQEKIQQSQSRTDENLQKLLMYSSVKLDEETTKKVHLDLIYLLHGFINFVIHAADPPGPEQAICDPGGETQGGIQHRVHRRGL